MIAGVILVIIGIFVARPILQWMDTPADVIDHSVLYMQIYFIGMPVTMAYNFGAAILRAVGDTRRPLYYLTIAGVLNVALNMVFVIVFHMGVAGVALATIISQALSAALVLLCLMKSEGDYQLRLKELRIVPDKLASMMKIGVPAGLQSSLFSFSNVIIQSSVNSFGSVAMAGNSAAQNLEGFVYTSMNAFYQATISFTSQNYGAKKYSRVKKGFWFTFMAGEFLLGAMAFLCFAFAPTLAAKFQPDETVVSIVIPALRIHCIGCMFLPFSTCGNMMFQSTGLAGKSAVLSALRSGLCFIPLVLILPVFFDLAGIQVSQPIADIITFSVSVPLVIRFFKELPGDEI